MRLTRRGWAALAVVALAVGLAALAGERSLNAVAAPLLGALAYGTVQLVRADAPTVRATELPPGYPGDDRQVAFDFDGRGVVHVTLDWPAGLDGESIDAVVGLPARLDATVTLAERGVYDLSALTVRRRDALGLLESPTGVDVDVTAVVYPAVARVADPAALAPVLADEHRVERQAFEALREYRPGDPLRHVHWKSSAKHDDFLVMEFAPARRTETVTIAADADPGQADEMAAAVGTVALEALHAGHDVAVSLPGEHVPAGSGDAHRANLLQVLARVGAGTVADERHQRADVSVRASPAETSIAVGGRSVPLGDLVAADDAGPRREVAAA